MLSQFVFSETSPATASTNAVSSQPVTGVYNASGPGIASSKMLDDAAAITVVAELVGATGGTLDIFLQGGNPDGSWVDVVHFAQLAPAAAAINYSAQISHMAQPSSAAPVAVGLGVHSGSTGLAASTTVQGLAYSQYRLLMCSGSGTTAGAPVKIYLTAQRETMNAA
jgi:hypothetical protein